MHGDNFEPFSAGVYKQKKHRFEERSGEVDVHSLPRTSGPLPRMKSCAERLFLLKLATVAFADGLLDVLVDSQPPDATAGELLHLHDARVCSSWRMRAWRDGGMVTREPQSRQP